MQLKQLMITQAYARVAYASPILYPQRLALTCSKEVDWVMEISSAISRRNLNTSAAENTKEFSSSRSPGCFHVLNSASKDWNPGLENMMSSVRDGWKD